jgi:hypothetical protein
MNSQAQTIVDRAVEAFATQKNVSNPVAQGESSMAGGTLVTVKFQRDNRDSWAWYFEKGEVQKVLFRPEDMASFITSQIKPGTLSDLIRSTSFSELIKTIMVSILTLIFAISVILIVARDPDNKSLQVLTGLLGLTIGYFVGKTDKSS